MNKLLRGGIFATGALFLLVAANFLFNPVAAAAGFGLTPDGAHGMASIRVDLTSLFAALGILQIWGGWKLDRHALNLAAALLALALMARLFSAAVDGTYQGWIMPGVIELVGMVLAALGNRSLKRAGE